MKPLFEIPELLTLNGSPVPGGIDAEGCCSGCDLGSGKGVSLITKVSVKFKVL